MWFLFLLASPALATVCHNHLGILVTPGPNQLCIECNLVSLPPPEHWVSCRQRLQLTPNIQDGYRDAGKCVCQNPGISNDVCEVVPYSQHNIVSVCGNGNCLDNNYTCVASTFGAACQVNFSCAKIHRSLD